MKYGIIYTIPRTLKAFDGTIMTDAGTQCYVRWDERDHWDTASKVDSSFPKPFKTFDSEEKAHEFMKTWEGHPWYFGRKVGDPYEVVSLKPRMAQVGWDHR